jgi:preprotein translocase subunit SecA
VGTTSVEKSERISKELKKARIPHEVLNAKHHEREAAIVAMAGHKGAVTVATNMAGRGTDIMLGGNVEFLADAQLRKQGLDPVETADEYTAAWPKALADAEQSVAAEKQEVIDAGGLAVIGTERHDSRRIDNQLRGRSGRQGDPGASRFYLSLEDDLMRLFKGDWVKWVLETMRIPDDVPIENKRITSQVASAQALVEEQNFESRKNILKYDDVMNSQRTVVYRDRRQVLEGLDLRDRVVGMIERVVGDYVKAATEGAPSDWDFDALWTALGTLYPVTVAKPDDASGGLEASKLEMLLVEDALNSYATREADLGDEVIRELERRVVLSVLDRKWREHLYEMDYLREGIGLRAYSQRDPLVEYQREGFDLFTAMMESIAEESVGYLFNLDVQINEDGEGDDGTHVSAKGLESDSAPRDLTYSAPSEDGSAVVVGASASDSDDEGDKARQTAAKNKARQKAKAQKQSRKRNR